MVNITTILSAIRDNIVEEMGFDYAENWPGLRRETEAELENLIIDFLEKSSPSGFFHVENIVEKIITADDINMDITEAITETERKLYEQGIKSGIIGGGLLLSGSCLMLLGSIKENIFLSLTGLVFFIPGIVLGCIGIFKLAAYLRVSGSEKAARKYYRKQAGQMNRRYKIKEDIARILERRRKRRL
jgi:pilus assembly protein TadC